MSALWINISKILSLLIFTSVASASHKIFRLEGGQTPYEGRVSVHLKDAGWMPVCSDGLNTDGADVICNELGFSAGAMWVKSPKVEAKSLTSGCVYVNCPEGSKSWAQCYYNLTHASCNCKQAKASCNYYGYRGCYNLGNLKSKLTIPYAVGQLTIQECLRFCRKYRFGAVLKDKCKCFNSDIEDGKRGSNAICRTACSGDDNHACGGTFPNYGVYESQMGACGGKYSANNGTIYSPQFPGCYFDKSSCSWSVTSIEDHVSLDFTILNFSDESFEITVTEEHDGSVTMLGRYNKKSPPTSTILSRSEKTVMIQLNMVKESGGCTMFAIDIKDKVPPTGKSVQPSSISTETTESSSNTGLENAGQGLPLGLILGPVLGVTALVLLIILMIVCCRSIKKRDSEHTANDEPADATVPGNYISEAELQYYAQDEIYECRPTTDTRSFEKTTDTSEKSQDKCVNAYFAYETKFDAEYSYLKHS
ncbi:kremen protein 2-like [Ptychodera flava]|uniref:kremen protein 2-like n=1 Tax=Ptychodera flava TaxID=63121 RepID=UPI00396A7734